MRVQLQQESARIASRTDSGAGEDLGRDFRDRIYSFQEKKLWNEERKVSHRVQEEGEAQVAVAIGLISRPYKRNITHFHSNVIHSRDNIYVGGTKKLEIIRNETDDPFEDSLAGRDLQDRLVDHSCRRTMMVYYLALAYYRSGCTVTRDKTAWQHGTALSKGFSAAHSTLLPEIKDNFFEVLKKRVQAHGMGLWDAEFLIGLGISEERIEGFNVSMDQRDPFGPAWEALLEGVQSDRLLAEANPLHLAQNATVALPNLVNRTDTHIENHLRDAFVEQLNECAAGKISPYGVMKWYVQDMKSYCDLALDEGGRKLSHLQSMEVLEKEFHELQQKILEGPADEIEVMKKLLHIAKELKSKQADLGDMRQSIGVKSATRRKLGNLYPSLGVLTPYIHNLNRVLHQKGKLCELAGRLRNAWKKESWQPQSWEDLIHTAKVFNETLIIQGGSTQVPDLSLLSGTSSRRRRLEMDEAELANQQLRLLIRPQALYYED